MLGTIPSGAMSGSNPFRRSTTAPIEREIPPRDFSLTINQDTTSSTNAAQTSKDSSVSSSHRSKTVRIASPAVPPSPPNPTSSATTFAFANTPQDAQYSELPFPTSPNTGRSSEPFSLSRRAKTSSSGDVERHVDPNPIHFDTAHARDTANLREKALSKRLANMPVFGSGYSQSEPASPMSKRGTLDVDGFTRMLLTGDAERTRNNELSNTPATSSQVTNLLHGVSDSSSSSNVDAISLLQQSGDSHGEVSAETPRTSHELSTSEADDIQTFCQPNPPPGEKKSKPPPPKTRRGKLIKPDILSTPPTTSSQPTEQPEIPSFTTEDDSVKTLESLTEKVSQASVTATSIFQDAEGRGVSLNRPSSQLKKPPTPPLARRRSQMKPGTKTKELQKRISLPLSSLPVSLASPSSPGLRTPPPPPTRRQDRTSTMSQPEPTLQLRSPISQEFSTISTDNPTATPLPSRSASVKSSKQGLPSTSSTMAPPPLPPPRRFRASSRSSTGSNQHPSYLHHDKGDEKEDEDEEAYVQPTNVQDILADLSRLQKEVDDLRGQYIRKASS